MSESDIPTTPPPTAPAPTREEIIAAVSKTLIARREERSLTLEKVAQIIKIRLFYLQAIEKGTWGDLPGEVYVRGFIKRYATFLGVDGNALMAPYIAMQTPVDASRPSSPSASHQGEFNRMQFLWVGLVGIFIVVFIKLIQNEHTAPIRSGESVSTPVAVSTAVITGVTPAGSNLAVGKHTIDVFSPLPLWLRVTSSDKTFEGFIPQSSSWSWKGTGPLTIRFGHTKQVALHFDGQPVPLLEDQRAITLPNAN